ncbi:unnamed protein product, partial [Oppiella nova]
MIVNRIYKLQNPPNCRLASKFVCILQVKWGFGYIMHHYTYCLILALKLNRTLIIRETITNTYTSNMKTLIRPISDTCLDQNGDNSTTWEGMSDQTHHYYQVINFYFNHYSKVYLQDMRKLTQFNIELQSQFSQPLSLFIGLLLRYLMRPTLELSRYYDNYKQRIQWKHPIVGPHVRRTDKLWVEAKYHSMDEYIKYVDQLVYLATDEPNVWLNELSPYIERQIEFTGDPHISRKAFNNIRNSYESIRDLIVEVLVLSECDYIVCTFSSNVCRLGFELRMSRINNSLAFQSLDKKYYYNP